MKKVLLMVFVGVMIVSAFAACGQATTEETIIEETPSVNVDTEDVTSEDLSDDFLLELQQRFETPSMDTWPEIRWWLAEGSHTDETLKSSLQEVYDAGFRAVEVLTLTESSLDKETYGWGSEEWYHDTMVIMEEATRLGMGVSFTSGPNWQPAIPGISPNDDAASHDIVFAWTQLQAGETFNGNLPEPADESSDGNQFGSEVEDSSPALNLQRVVAVKLEGEYNESETTYLDGESVVDLTDTAVTNNGHFTLDWTAPDDGEYMLFAYYLHGVAQTASSSAETTYVVNHFNRAGAQALIKFWDNYMMTDEMRNLIQENGNVDFFMDSLEIRATNSSYLFWDESFLSEFETRRGYDLTPYLPTIIRIDQQWISELNDPVFDYAGQEKTTEKVRNDVAQTLSELYESMYLEPIREWLNSLGINLRVQVSYGIWLEQSQSIPYVDIPEVESLFFSDLIDAYRMQTGVSHLYGKNIISNELGPIFLRSYHASMQEYLVKANAALIGGSNRLIFHGYSSKTGPEESTNWPGYEGIGFMVSERFGDRMPYWKDIDEITTYLARLQDVLREGTQKVDVGVINLSYWSPNFFAGGNSTYWNDDDTMQEEGFTFEYFSPNIMTDSETFTFDGSVISSDGPAYQAIVLHQSEIPYDSLSVLLDYANEGLPVVVLSDIDNVSSPYNDDTDAAIAQAVSELVALPNVAVVDDKKDIATALRKLGITPRADYSHSSEMVTLLRDAGDAKYLVVYNPTKNDLTETVSVEDAVSVYEMDPWTGNVTKNAVYDYSDGRTEFQVALGSEAIKVYVLNADAELQTLYAEESNADEILYGDGDIQLIASQSGTYTTQLSNGATVKTEVKLPDPIDLSGWSLRVEDWQEGEQKSISEERNGHTTTEYYYETKIEEIEVELDNLKTWDEISEVGREVSGIGYYTTSFELTEEWLADSGVILDMGTLFGTAEVFINGQKSLPVNQNDAKVDISDLIVEGENKLEIIATTTLANRLFSTGIMTESAAFSFPGAGEYVMGNTYGVEEITYESFGLVQATLVPYAKVSITGAD